MPNLVKLSGAVGRRLGVTVQRKRPFRDATRHLLCKMEELGIETLLDVGANKGQFARDARASGFHGDISSFEPLAVARAICSAAARSDPRWTGYRTAVCWGTRGSVSVNLGERR